uniref:hypothetical protein n=1 Tax=Candidatus Fimivicinus sp. TaxID=3056640 RepID=UPI003FF122A0
MTLIAGGVKWDSLDRAMYRDGGRVDLKVVTHNYVFHRNLETGESYSDHVAAVATMHIRLQAS